MAKFKVKKKRSKFIVETISTARFRTPIENQPLTKIELREALTNYGIGVKSSSIKLKIKEVKT